jgi:hypothetical protein
MSLLDYAVHTWLIHKANPGTGIAWTNAAGLAYECNCSRSLAQKYLCRLERRGYLRRFPTPRSHKPYAILLNRFECTQMPQKGFILNAVESKSWLVPVYSRRTQSGTQSGTQSHMDRARGDLRLDTKPKPKTRPQPPRPLPANPLRETEQRRKIAARDNRLDVERHTRAESRVGHGPSDDRPLLLLGCVECKRELTGTQLARCLAGKPPAGPGSTCPRYAEQVRRAATGTQSAGVSEDTHRKTVPKFA